MNLPLVIDIVIGLVFIYLTLSLLASEVQELLATLLQWRAKHLRQAIETLLAGAGRSDGSRTIAADQAVQAQIEQSKQLATDLYAHPLLRSLNQESKGIIGGVARWISDVLRVSPFFGGQSSAPSYIPADAFSSTLLELLRLPELAMLLNSDKLDELIQMKVRDPIQNLLTQIRNSKADYAWLDHEMNDLEADLQAAWAGFNTQELSLSAAVQQVRVAVRAFAANAAAIVPPDDYRSDIVIKRLAALEEVLKVLPKEPRAGAVELIQTLKRLQWVAQQMHQQGGQTHAVLARLPNETLQRQFRQGHALLERLAAVGDGDANLSYIEMLALLPPHVMDSLYLLAQQAQNTASSLDQEVTQFRQSVATWFDQSMERATGVYKRNAKGVAIAIGLLLAVITNTDMVYIANRLGRDPGLRAAYSSAASELVRANPQAAPCLEATQNQAAQADCLQAGGPGAQAVELGTVLSQTSQLPLGWSADNWQAQWQPSQRGGVVLNGLKVLGGWLVSAFAVSMGAPFWFNLLNRFVNVRNTGSPPNSTQ